MSFAEVTARMEWGECWLPTVPVPRELAADVKRRIGAVPAWVERLAPVPWLVRASARVIEKRLAYMPLHLWDLIGFVVSQDNSCRYCYGVTRALLRVAGYDDPRIDRIEHDVHVAELAPADEAALDFARRVSHANPPATAADLARLAAAGFTPPAAAEIAYAAAFAGFSNRMATCFAIPPEPLERLVAGAFGRVMRPLIALQMRHRHAPPEPPPARKTPAADVVGALGDSPTAHAVRTIVDDAFASPVLPRRTKLLMFAVVGRALGCRRAEDEACHELDATELDRAAVDEILANLGSARLDRRDALLVPFARETVRYQAVALQHRTRDLVASRSTEEVIEAVGIAALANGLGRASALLESGWRRPSSRWPYSRSRRMRRACAVASAPSNAGSAGRRASSSRCSTPSRASRPPRSSRRSSPRGSRPAPRRRTSRSCSPT